MENNSPWPDNNSTEIESSKVLGKPFKLSQDSSTRDEEEVPIREEEDALYASPRRVVRRP